MQSEGERTPQARQTDASAALLAEIEFWAFKAAGVDYHGIPDKQRAESFKDELMAMGIAAAVQPI